VAAIAFPLEIKLHVFRLTRVHRGLKPLFAFPLQLVKQRIHNVCLCKQFAVPNIRR
jgi:hypothetical protein